MGEMRFRLGLMIGGAAGYVLGARAGRERYEDIKQLWAKARRHPAVSQVVDQAQGVTDLGRKVVANGLDKGSETLRDRS
jgi:hypothetical protein